ncbi:hypothetical protein F8N00_14120 [Exiguobacterium sp. A1_3_1]|uniref:Uncharacterized protein n=1 Tax=Exiguobacterium indicum TaxID=296995 RepID=A0ABU8EIH2_9BACL
MSMILIFIQIILTALYLCNPYANSVFDFVSSSKYLVLFHMVGLLVICMYSTIQLKTSFEGFPFLTASKIKAYILFVGMTVIILVTVVPLAIYSIYAFSLENISHIVLYRIIKFYTVLFLVPGMIGGLFGSFIGNFILRIHRKSTKIILVSVAILLIGLLVYDSSLQSGLNPVIPFDEGYFDAAFSLQSYSLLTVLLLLTIFLLTLISLLISSEFLLKITQSAVLLGCLCLIAASFQEPSAAASREKFLQSVPNENTINAENSHEVSKGLPITKVNTTQINDSRHYVSKVFLSKTVKGKYSFYLSKYMKINNLSDSIKVIRRDSDKVTVKFKNNTSFSITYSYVPNLQRVISDKYIYLPASEPWYPMRLDGCENQMGHINLKDDHSQLIQSKGCITIFDDRYFIRNKHSVVPIDLVDQLDDDAFFKQVKTLHKQVNEMNGLDKKELPDLIIAPMSSFDSTQHLNETWKKGNQILVALDLFLKRDSQTIQQRIILNLHYTLMKKAVQDTQKLNVIQTNRIAAAFFKDRLSELKNHSPANDYYLIQMQRLIEDEIKMDFEKINSKRILEKFERNLE